MDNSLCGRVQLKEKKTQKAKKLKTEKKSKRGEGVCVYKQKNSWIAKVWSSGVRVYLGSHPHEFAAKEAVKKYRQSLYKRLED